MLRLLLFYMFFWGSFSQAVALKDLMCCQQYKNTGQVLEKCKRNVNPASCDALLQQREKEIAAAHEEYLKAMEQKTRNEMILYGAQALMIGFLYYYFKNRGKKEASKRAPQIPRPQQPAKQKAKTPKVDLGSYPKE